MSPALQLTRELRCYRCEAPASVCGVHAVDRNGACLACDHRVCADIRARQSTRCLWCNEPIGAGESSACGQFHAGCLPTRELTHSSRSLWVEFASADVEFLARVEVRDEPEEGWL